MARPRRTRKGSDVILAQRNGLVVAAALLGLLAALLLSQARVHTATVDEFADVPAGLAALEAGDFALDARNPPLLKMLMALPPALAGAQVPETAFRRVSTGWWPWIHGTRFLRLNPETYDQLIFLARLPVVLLALGLGWLIFVWARERHGPEGGLAALALFVLSPTVLAHGSLATLDLGAAFFFFATARAVDRHLSTNSLASLVACGTLTGLALATKFSTVLLLPALAILLAVGRRGPWPARLSGAAARLTVIGLLAVLVLEVVYGLPKPTPLPREQLRSPLGVAARGLMGDLPLPLPPAFVRGFDDAMVYAREPEIPGYLNGRWSRQGWWYYHLEAFVIKEPLPLLALLALAAVARPRERVTGTGPDEPPRRAGTLALAIPPLLLLLSLLMFNRVQYGLRYALPLYPFLFVGAGRLAALADSRWRRGGLAVLFAALFAATLSLHPNHLSSFNSLVGGPARGFHFLADSNLDWGQDLRRLARHLAREYPDRTVKLAYFGHVDPAHYGIRHEILRGRKDAQGLLAVSASYLAGQGYAITWRGPVPEAVPPGAHAWLADERPVGRVGYSIYLYDLP